MGTGSVCFILLIGISIPIVKSNNPFHDYYYNKYHKGSTTSTTTSTSEFGTSESEFSSSQDISTTAEELPLTSLDDYAADKTTSVEDDMKSSLEANTTIIQHGDSYDDPSRYAFLTRIGIVLCYLLPVILCLGCIACCCTAFRRRKERRGFVIANNAGERATEIHPQPVVTQPALNAPAIQHFPPEFSPEPVSQFPPHYQHQPVQPQPRYSPIQPDTNTLPYHSPIILQCNKDIKNQKQRCSFTTHPKPLHRMKRVCQISFDFHLQQKRQNIQLKKLVIILFKTRID